MTWADVDWGTFPDWLGGVGSILAFAGFGLALWREVRLRRRDDAARAAEAADAQAAQARLVFTTIPHGHDTQVRTGVHNASTGPVFVVEVKLFRGPRDAMRPAKVGRDVPIDSLPPGGERDVWLTLVSGEEPPLGDGEEFWLRLEFTDAAGLRWRRVDNGQPVRVLADPSSV